jgi:phosphoglycerate-specific signal transduction histidine kinase
MKRAVIAFVLALAALALLISLALESRSLPVETHVAQYTITGNLQRLDDDFEALVETLEAAWGQQAPPGEGARALLQRVAAQPRQLPESLFTMQGSSSQEARLRNSQETFLVAVGQATALAEELIADQTAYAAAVSFLREEGAAVIQELRDANLDRQSADTFQLVVGTLDFAGKDASVRAGVLDRLLVTLSRDQHVDTLSSDFGALLASVETILKSKPLIESKMQQLAATPVGEHAAALGTAAQEMYTNAVTRIEQARLMLSIYAVVLLLSVGFIAVRLQRTYQQVNRANMELAVLNESLEQRVASRTNELSGTLSELKESQVQLVQAEKMSSLGQLVAGISHEINTPLLYLANNAELIRERLEPLRDFVTACVGAFSIKAEEFPDRAAYQQAFVGALRDV